VVQKQYFKLILTLNEFKSNKSLENYYLIPKNPVYSIQEESHEN
jgi:hypothetical protein